MPLPQPSAGEQRQEFIGRCMSDLKGEFPDQDQRLAVCHKQWRGKDSMARPTHKTTREGDQVRIHDLELFVGYDPSIDNPDNRRIRKFTRRRVAEVVDRTKKFIRRGQHPKLILGHNPKDPDRHDKEPRPTIGDIPRIRMVDIRGVAGIVGDVVMNVRDFEQHLRSNAFPRRSAEIWPDGFLSEVALLGSTTPARPIPDTRFRRGEVPEIFSRTLPKARFGATLPMSEPGSHNAGPPRAASRKRRRYAMPKDNGDDKDKEPIEEEREDDEDDKEQLQAKLLAAHDAIDDLKERLSKYEADDEEADKSARTMELEREDFERKVEEQERSIGRLQRELRSEKFGRKLDEMRADGYQVGDRKRQAALLDRIIKAEHPDRELAFIKEMMGRDPVDTHIDMRGAATGGGNRQEMEKQQTAANKARDRCVNEGKPENFDRYYEEALSGV